LIKDLRAGEFDQALSVRWDPRDHVLLWLSGARKRIGYPRRGSGILLTDRLPRPARYSHRFDLWKRAGAALAIPIPTRQEMPSQVLSGRRQVVVHTGAGAPVRVWPLERWRVVIAKLRMCGCDVRLLCDSSQRSAWLAWGEHAVRSPADVAELIQIFQGAGAFIGHDSGPGHLAALVGVPTFTIFGPQLPESFVPIHPGAQWIDGRTCPHKPCFDYCRYPVPHCIHDLSVDEVLDRMLRFVRDPGLTHS
jgi:ADP-heptose:LPS heptosyltransferase